MAVMQFEVLLPPELVRRERRANCRRPRRRGEGVVAATRRSGGGVLPPMEQLEADQGVDGAVAAEAENEEQPEDFVDEEDDGGDYVLEYGNDDYDDDFLGHDDGDDGDAIY